MKIKTAAIRIKGDIYTGTSHEELIKKIAEKKNILNYLTLEFGFVTDTDEFIGRSEAAEIAYKAGQTRKKLDNLTSEDIIIE